MPSSVPARDFWAHAISKFTAEPQKGQRLVDELAALVSNMEVACCLACGSRPAIFTSAASDRL